MGIPPASLAFRPGRYLTFRLAARDFAMDADRVRGILPVEQMTEVVGPSSGSLALCSHAWACGVASLHGRDFPVIDLCGKLQLDQRARGREPMIVVAEVNAPEGLQLAGFVADHVCDVITAHERDYRRGKLRCGGRPRMVLDTDALLTREPAELVPTEGTEF